MFPVVARCARAVVNRLFQHGTSRGQLRTAPLPPAVQELESRTLFSTYYISPTGSDNNNGLSTATPWKTIAKVDATTFHRGDNVLFQAGQAFYGSLVFRSGGTASIPLTIGSYGLGRATISSGTAAQAAYVYNAGGIWFENLNFAGTPGSSSQDGIRFLDGSPNTFWPNIRVNDCQISGYTRAGILVQGDDTTGGFSNIQITDNSIHDNVDSGIEFVASAHGANQNVLIAGNQIYNNYGDGHSAVTGNGMMLGDLNGAVVEYNSAYNNGAKGGNGNCGIWAYASNAVTFQYNLSYDNRTTGGQDGDGFDFDSDTSNSTMQYNYAYGNDGNGLQLNQWRNDSISTNDTVRYNVAADNGQRNNYAQLEVWGHILNSSIYNNVAIAAPATRGGNPSGLKVHNASVPSLFVSNLSFANNVVIATGGVPLVNVPSAELAGAKNLKFLQNDYWTYGGTVRFAYGSTYSSLTTWRSSTGQEKLNGAAVGLQLNPDLLSPLSPPALTNPHDLSALSGVSLLSNSPLINRGINVSAVLSTGSAADDFFGDPLPQSGACDIGVDELLE